MTLDELKQLCDRVKPQERGYARYLTNYALLQHAVKMMPRLVDVALVARSYLRNDRGLKDIIEALNKLEAP